MKVNPVEIREQESYIQFELYRVLKEYILKVSKNIFERSIFDMPNFKWEKNFGVYPEVRVNGEWIDLLVAIDDDPFLVIETKKRYKNETNSISKKVLKTNSYAKKIGARYYAVCNGWILLLFSIYDYPYFLGVYGVEFSEAFAKNLLLGLAKFYFGKRETDIFSNLPKVPDRFDLEKKIIPAVLNRYAKIESQIDPKTYLNTWLRNIH